jgi:hypothetical protein
VTLFAMLFGVSIFLVGGERSDLERGAILRKRLAWMVVFGLLHGFAIWFGDVLLSYALAGFAVMLARSWAPKKLIRTGVIIWVVFSLLMTAGMTAAFVFQHDATQATLETAKAIAKSRAAEVQYGGTFLQSLIQNAKDRLEFLPGEPFIFVMTSALMMIGLGCFKLGVLTGEASKRTYVNLIAVGLTASAIIAGLVVAQILLGLPRPLVDAVHGGPVDDRAADDPGLCRPDGVREPLQGLVGDPEGPGAGRPDGVHELSDPVADHDRDLLRRPGSGPARQGRPAGAGGPDRGDVGPAAPVVALVDGPVRDGPAGVGLASPLSRPDAPAPAQARARRRLAGPQRPREIGLHLLEEIEPIAGPGIVGLVVVEGVGGVVEEHPVDAEAVARQPVQRLAGRLPADHLILAGQHRPDTGPASPQPRAEVREG